MLTTYNIRLAHIVSSTWKHAVYSAGTATVAYALNEFWLSKYFSFPAFVPTILGTALAFFIGFNNNQAYDRWWEARKIWGGLVNDSRTWCRQVLAYMSPHEGEKALQRRLVERHLAFLYALKANLRKDGASDHLRYLQPTDAAAIAGKTNIPNALLQCQAEDLDALERARVVDGFRFRAMDGTLQTFCEGMGRSERIANTVYPPTYNHYAKNFIWIFVYSVTMVIGNSIGVWAIVFGTLLGYVFFTIQSIGQVLLDPFEARPTGIPLDRIVRTIEIDLLQALKAEGIPAQTKPEKGEYLL